MAKRFRKVFVICEDNKVFTTLTRITIYKTRDDAEYMCKREQAKALEEKKRYWNSNVVIPKFKVHGFYLVHEDMFRD